MQKNKFINLNVMHKANRQQQYYNQKLVESKKLFKENTKILNRILDIGQSKSHSLIPKRQISRQSSASSVKSLNISYRKSVAQKIVYDNEQLMKRLQRTTPTLRRKDEYNKEYQKTMELKSRISKQNSQSKQKLNPIKSTSGAKYSSTAKEFKRPQKIEPRFNQTAKPPKPSYQTSSLAQLRIGREQTLQFPRIK